eukprot:COSAG01_NODE_52418_length_346_cov_12.801619_1_plen_51_part_10
MTGATAVVFYYRSMIPSIGPGSASHYEIQQQQQQESAKMNIVLSTAESEKQ